MVQLLGWILLLSALSAGMYWLAEHPGALVIDWLGYRIHASIGLLLALFVFGLVVLIPLMLFVWKIVSIPKRFKKNHSQRHYTRGLEALTTTITAMATDDEALAERSVKQAEKYLGSKPLVALLQAQIAYRAQDKESTAEHLHQMLEHKQTRFIAMRALSTLAVQDGDLGSATEYAEKALKLQGNNVWTLRMLCDLYLRQHAWQQVEQLLRNARRFRRLPKEMAARLLAISAYLQSLHSESQGERNVAFVAARQAYQTCPGFTPASLHYLRLLAGDKKMLRRALQVIYKSWSVQPHPQLVDMLLRLTEGEKDAKRLKRFEPLLKRRGDHVQSQLAMARAYMRNQVWDSARNHLKSALSIQECCEAYKLLATVEKAEPTSGQGADEWLKRAADVPAAEVWLCEHCGHQHVEWTVHCHQCHQFDRVVWTSPLQVPEGNSPLQLLMHGG